MDKLLLLGGTGLVGSRILELLKDKFEIVAPPSIELDVTDQVQIKQKVEQIKPDLILYAAGFTDVDLAEEKKEYCYAINVTAAEYFVNETSKINIPLFYLSTDYVFDGIRDDRPYKEEDEPKPVDSIYAKSKREGELVVLNSSNKNCVIRLIMPFSAVYKEKSDIARLVLDKLRKGEKLPGIIDQKVNPIFVDDLVLGIGKILEIEVSGIYHLGATTYSSPCDFMKQIARTFNLNENLIEETTFGQFSKTRVAKRPHNSWLDTSKFRAEFGEGILHSIEDEIKLFKQQIDIAGIGIDSK